MKKSIKKTQTKKQSRTATKKISKAPVYKSGMIGGKPMNYKTAKRGIITSLD